MDLKTEALGLSLASMYVLCVEEFSFSKFRNMATAEKQHVNFLI